jgi:hypothetical protein
MRDEDAQFRRCIDFHIVDADGVFGDDTKILGTLHDLLRDRRAGG